MPLQDLALPLETPRVRIRGVEAKDAAALYAVETHPAVKKYMPAANIAPFDEWAPKFQSIMLAEQLAGFGHGYMVVESKSSGCVIGRCGIVKLSLCGSPVYYDNQISDIQVFLTQVGEGIGIEVGLALIDAAFRHGDECLFASTHRDNAAARRMITEGCGFARSINRKANDPSNVCFVLTAELFRSWRIARETEK